MSAYKNKAFFPMPESEAPSTMTTGGHSFYPAKSTLKFLSVFFIFISFLLCLPAPSWSAIVEVDLINSHDKYPAGGTYPILLNLRITKSWYIHSATGGGNDYLPTVLSFKTPDEIKIVDINFPSPVKRKFEYEDGSIELYTGELLVKATLKVSKKAAPNTLTIKGKLEYQACTSKYCMPPESEPFQFSLTIAPVGAKTMQINPEMFKGETDYIFWGPFAAWKENAGFWLILLGIFLGGLALNLTPCIYPLIPITVSYFGGMSSQIRGRTIIHGLLYVSGLSITNSLLGLTASLSGSMLGSTLQNPVVLVIVSGILLFLAASFFDIWELQLPSVVMRMASMNFGGYFGTFFMGLTLGIVAAPCLGPFMLGLLTYVAQKGDPFLGFLYFFVLSIGLGLPLTMLAIFSGALKKLPMSGEWLRWIRKILGWVLVLMAAFMLLPLISEPSAKGSLIAVMVGAAGVHLGWIEKSHGSSRPFRFIRKGAGYLLVLSSFVMLSIAIPKHDGVQWKPYDPKLLANAAKNNTPVILDFYADWCSPCKALEKKVFRDTEVAELSRQFVTLRVDLTTKHALQEELQEQYNIRGVPTIVFINGKGVVQQELRIESYLGRDEVINRMKQLIDGPS